MNRRTNTAIHKGENTSSANTSNTPKKRQARERKNDFIKPNNILRIKSGVDRPMLIIIVLLLCFGSVMVFSASFATAYSETGDSYFYIKSQIKFALIGLVVMFIATRFDYRWMRKVATPFFIVMLVLLAMVPIYGISKGAATRWIIIGGIRFQPSELMKTSLVLFLSHYIATHQDKITNYRDFKQSSIWGDFIPVGIVGIVCLLIAAEFHFSGVIIMFLIGMIVIFAGGARKIWFGIAGGLGGFVVLMAILFTDYARKRIDIWLHPENYSAIDEVWQTTQGLYAIGSGGFLGVGLGNSFQKYNFVSEPQNDFIFSIVCEELGFVGALMVITLFVLFIWRGFVIAMKAPDTFSSLVVIGIVGKVAIQAILNIAVVTAVIPNTGITLPFFSYGGTALVILLGEMGILLSISRYSYQQKYHMLKGKRD